MMLGSGGLPSTGGPIVIASATIVAITSSPNRASRQAASGQNGTPSRSSSSLYQLRRLRNAVANDQIKVKSNEKEDEGGNKEDVQGEKPAERCATYRVASKNKVAQPVADERSPASLLSRHYDGPKACLVPPQELAGKRHT